MASPRSKLSRQVTQGYWVAVRQQLEKRHGLSEVASRRAISSYKSMLAEIGVGDVIYHSPIAETAEGIINGGYATASKSGRTVPRAGRPRVRA